MVQGRNEKSKAKKQDSSLAENERCTFGAKSAYMEACIKTDQLFDLAIIGGGINGAGIARDAAGRGLSVLLCEQDDLAQHTSSASTKLIHGGLRYLEHGEFRLVRKALQEREVLLRAAPHLIWPLRFVLPHDAGMRPLWMIRAGLFLYDHLARREILPGSSMIHLDQHLAGAALKSQYRKAFVYSDAWVDDARLVVLNALDAKERGTSILTRTRCLSARRSGSQWHLQLENTQTGRVTEVRSRALVNAAGPWVAHVLSDTLNVESQHRIRLVKGSHIIVRKQFDHPYAYIFQNPDRRIIFAIPYEHDFTLIGTTDVDYHGDPSSPHIDEDETKYLCEMASRSLNKPITPEDVLHSYSGVRPLLDDAAHDASSVTRDYWLELNGKEGRAPVLSVFGGKITTYRKLAEEAMDQLLPLLKATPSVRQHWTAQVPLPGGDLPSANFDHFLTDLLSRYSFIPEKLIHRLARAYGNRTFKLLGEARSLNELGAEIAPHLYERELTYLRDIEWARTGEDVLKRRSKLGLHLSDQDQLAVARWMNENSLSISQ